MIPIFIPPVHVRSFRNKLQKTNIKSKLKVFPLPVLVLLLALLLVALTRFAIVVFLAFLAFLLCSVALRHASIHNAIVPVVESISITSRDRG